MIYQGVPKDLTYGIQANYFSSIINVDVEKHPAKSMYIWLTEVWDIYSEVPALARDWWHGLMQRASICFKTVY